jgi:hypothetical protein
MEYNNNHALTPDLWESPALIPVLLMVVKEHLAQWEHMQSLVHDEEVNRYLAICQHWKQTALNERQRQWLQEIEFYLQESSRKLDAIPIVD